MLLNSNIVNLKMHLKIKTKEEGQLGNKAWSSFFLEKQFAEILKIETSKSQITGNAYCRGAESYKIWNHHRRNDKNRLIINKWLHYIVNVNLGKFIQTRKRHYWVILRKTWNVFRFHFSISWVILKVTIFMECKAAQTCFDRLYIFTWYYNL